jgi:DNA-binding LacI/PurR family transcriptional regulator
LPRITIKNIAKKAGVSITTVSSALNNSRYVKKETKKKILKIAKDENYEPSYIARAIRTRRTKTVALLVPAIAPAIDELIKGVEQKLTESGYCLILFNTRDSIDKELEAINLIQERVIDGIIISGILGGKEDEESLVKRVKEIGKPTIFCDRYIQNTDIPFVSIDNKSGGKIAGEYLIKMGHKKIGILSYDPRIKIVKKRKEGFINALKDAGLEAGFVLEIPIQTENIKENIYKNKDFLLKSDLTAIFAVTDILALHLIKLLFLNKVKVPDDISIIGFDNSYFSEISIPGLTTIDHDLVNIGKIAAENLIYKLETNRFNKRKIIMKTKLIERDSVRRIT